MRIKLIAAHQTDTTFTLLWSEVGGVSVEVDPSENRVNEMNEGVNNE